MTWAGSFTITDTKTANYQAKNGEMVPVNTSGGSFAVTAPLNLGQSTSFGIIMDHQDNPVTLIFAEPAEVPTADKTPHILTFDVVVNGSLYFVFNGTDWLIV